MKLFLQQEKSAVNKTFLIISISARALATAGAQAGHRIYCIDCFGDADTRDVCESVTVVEDFQSLYDVQNFKSVLSGFEDISFDGVVVGSGFEVLPSVLSEVGFSCPVFINDIDSITDCKTPGTIFPLLEKLEIRFPELLELPPETDDQYLVKQKAGSGGQHVRFWSDEDGLTSNEYLQRFHEGETCSATFIANGKDHVLLGINKTWCADVSEKPFMYGGAITKASLQNLIHSEIVSIVEKLTTEFKLKGLCGLDFLISPEQEVLLLDINPRPTQSMELYDDGSAYLFHAHIESFHGVLSEFVLQTGCMAHEIIYAEDTVEITEDVFWPIWVRNRPAVGSKIGKHEPVCTVFAKAANERLTLAQLAERRQTLGKLLAI